MIRQEGRAGRSPVLLESPHSGSALPADFAPRVPRARLRAAEDSLVDALFRRAARAAGAPLLSALFPRSYVDVNRALTSLDPAQIEGGWPGLSGPGDRLARAGRGLIWTRTRCQRWPLYDRKLTRAAIERRIARCYHPYHGRLAALIAAARDRHGAAVHLSCHSMASCAPRLTGGRNPALADIVLGDRRGRSCDPELTRRLAGSLRARGYSVAINDPFSGVELLRRHGRPAAGVHSLQIEIRRDLYMDEATRRPHAGFRRLERDLGAAVAAARDFARTAALARDAAPARHPDAPPGSKAPPPAAPPSAPAHSDDISECALKVHYLVDLVHGCKRTDVKRPFASVH